MSKLDTPGELIEDILKPGELIPLDVYATIIDPLESLLKVEVAKARHESFLGARLGCSFNPDCKSCHANKFTLNYLVEPETTEVESNKEGVEVND